MKLTAKQLQEKVERIQEDLDLTKFDRRIDRKLLLKCYNYLMSVLSPESQTVLDKFAKGAAGWNRGWTICWLSHKFGGPGKQIGGRGIDNPITKTSLRSYANSELFAFIENGDLVPEGKYFVPKSKVTTGNAELQDLILRVEQITGKKVILEGKKKLQEGEEKKFYVIGEWSEEDGSRPWDTLTGPSSLEDCEKALLHYSKQPWPKKNHDWNHKEFIISEEAYQKRLEKEELQSKTSLKEGVWANPKSESDKTAAILELIGWKKKYYNIVGSDSVFNGIDQAIEEIKGMIVEP